MPDYSIILPEETLARAGSYVDKLRSRRVQPGAFLRQGLASAGTDPLTATDLLGKLINTKKAQIFAESGVSGDGTDWNLMELGLLGDVSIATPVTIYDDGNHGSPVAHAPPFSGTLVFTPGALLRNDRGYTPADWNEVVETGGQLSVEGYYGLYQRRLLPVLSFINEHAELPRSAFVTVPGLGCGMFAGAFQGQLGVLLQHVLERLLVKHGHTLPNIKAIYFDPYSESEVSRKEIEGISLMVYPLLRSGTRARSQLCLPDDYAGEHDDFSFCRLYSVVAWDHVSWPGNDYYSGGRVTDDGVKAAATSSMTALTGLAGHYDTAQGKYLPPRPFHTWGDVVKRTQQKAGLQLWNPSALWRGNLRGELRS